MAETMKVTLKVVTHAGDLGLEGKVGQTVEVPADVAERWIAAGIADASEAPAGAGGAKAAAADEAEEEGDKPANATPTTRRGR